MPNDLTIQPITTVQPGNDTAGEPKAALFQTATQAAPANVSPPIANPSLRFDSALGLVVIEFHNDAGAITTSVPSERQLAAYQRWEETKFGPPPEGLPARSAAPPTGVPPPQQQAAAVAFTRTNPSNQPATGSQSDHAQTEPTPRVATPILISRA